MNHKEQAGIEYLMTYGWALILIAAVIGALVFIVGTPTTTPTFTSTNPGKILLKGGTIEGTTATAILQNITGGQIQITNITETGTYSNCKINGSATATIPAGATMQLQCTLFGRDPIGTITITY